MPGKDTPTIGTDRFGVGVWQSFERVAGVAIGIGVAALLAWSVASLQIDLSRTATGIVKGFENIGQMFPRSLADLRYDWRVIPSIRKGFGETVQMSVAGTSAGALMALPISFLAARTGAVPRWFSSAVKTVLNIGRAVPTIVYALIALSSVGLGKAAGAMAIAIVSFIGLAKLYAETLEAVSQGPVEAVRAAGGSPAQVFVYGMLPQVFPYYLATTLYTLEYNIKDSFIVGIVGAGGLGYDLMEDIGLFKWLDAGVILAALVILINVTDYISYLARRKFA